MWPLHYGLNWDILETLVFDERKTREAMEKTSEQRKGRVIFYSFSSLFFFFFSFWLPFVKQ